MELELCGSMMEKKNGVKIMHNKNVLSQIEIFVCCMVDVALYLSDYPKNVMPSWILFFKKVYSFFFFNKIKTFCFFSQMDFVAVVVTVFICLFICLFVCSFVPKGDSSLVCMDTFFLRFASKNIHQYIDYSLFSSTGPVPGTLQN